MTTLMNDASSGRVSRADGGTSDKLVRYYARRAVEYERIYDKPERQEDLQELRSTLCNLLSGHDVLEIACGTGYWTQALSGSARSILAVDAGEEVLAVARAKRYAGAKVRFVKADAYSLTGATGRFTAAFAGFWWSHVPLARLAEFLSILHGRLQAGARVALCDNNCVDDSNTPIARTDADGNTYQLRRLADGSTHEVLKNFPTEAQLRGAVGPAAVDVRHRSLPYYWCVSYELRQGLVPSRLAAWK
jgi:demethylmenaquinone methyltransferase/2-methoxy-6-polyprenyl-1,4-benzoquinol methylase